MNDFKDEIAEGHMCEQGFMKETFEDGDLKRKLTLKGKKECQKMLKEKKYQHWMINYIKEQIKQNPEKKEILLSGLSNILAELNNLK